MSGPEIKPCPFCGSKNVASFRHVRMQKEPSAMCRDCFGSATAVSKWNRRAEAPAAPKVKALVEALRWYASQDAWTIDQVEGPHGDYGSKARAAIAALEGGDG